MKSFWVVISVFILQHEFRIISAQEEQEESSMDRYETFFLTETPVPKTTQESSVELLSSYITIPFSDEEGNVYDSSELNFSIMHQFRSPFLETPQLPTTPSLFIQKSPSRKDTDYLTSDSLLDLDSSSNNAVITTETETKVFASSIMNSNLHNSIIDTHIYDSIEASSTIDSNLYNSNEASNIIDSVLYNSIEASYIIGSILYNNIEASSSFISSNLNTFSPVAESRIHILSSMNIAPISTSFHSEEIFTNTDFSTVSHDLRIVEVSNIDGTSKINENMESKLLEFPRENVSLVFNKTTFQPINSSTLEYSTFSLLTPNILTAGSSKSNDQIISSSTITEQLSSKTPTDKELFSNISNFDTNSQNMRENLKETNISHEIITDFSQPKNKTSRNEEPHLDDIISGIVHLLAGNVQLGRPGPNLFSNANKRPNRPPPPLHSTRINNRGPLSSATFSRTVVVFSQPQHPGHIATEIPRPVQFGPQANGGGLLSRPSNQNMQYVKIQPTKVGEKPPPGVSVIRFYHPNANAPAKNQAKPPFIGEIFTHNTLSLNPNVHLTNIPEGAFFNSVTNQIKLQNQKGSTAQSHFIFSDASGSSVVVVLSPLSSKVQTTSIVTPTENRHISPSKTYEVLADSSRSQNKVPEVKPFNATNLKPSKDSGFKESSPGHNVKPTSVLNDTPSIENTIVPFGPVTDWVPFLERPSVKFKPSNKTPLDEVSIIMQPIIFDITVSNSLNEIKISHNRTHANKSSKSTSTPIENERTLLPFSENSKLETDGQNPISPSIGNAITMTPTISIHKSEGVFTLQKLRTTSDELKNQRQSITSSLKADLTSSIIHIRTSASMRPENNVPPTNSYRTSPSLNAISSRAFGTLSSRTLNSASSRTFGASPPTPANIQPPLGRPIVIPVDIEEVRPFVGVINPVNQDKTKGTHSLYGGSYPYPVPPVQVTRAGVNAREDYSMSSTLPYPTSRIPIIRSQARPRPNTIRIDTCIVGDDSTCDPKLNETCKTEFGISSCHCRPGYARSYTRGPCVPVVSIGLSLKVDRIGNRKISFSPKYLDKNSEEYRIMEFEAKQALTSLFTHTAFSRIFFGANVNLFYTIAGKLIVNSTVFLEEKESTRAQSVRLRLRQEIAEAIKNRNQNIGESRLYVEGPLSPIINIEDVNECSDPNLNDCSSDGACLNVFGTFLCKCRAGYVDPLKHIERRSGRQCLACSPEYCTYHGQCFVERDQKLCKCQGNYIGSRCEIDGEVLGVALGASLAAIIIILLTLSCLCIWNRKWKKQQQKAEVLSARSYNSNQTFSYLSNLMNANANANPYQLTMEDRMRWAHISDVVKSAAMPNQECVSPYASTTLEPVSFPARYQYPNNKEQSFYDYRTRPRSRMLSHPGASPNAAYYEMDSPARGSYMTSSFHSTKRFQNPNKMLRY
ncbi:hypothetical protein JTE90_021284 [Oedothorax gibbosus]|uniref:63 kDa sperm flagellar membrane protein n=1 Tax=Oedothorax gibbosus TaxID=931172 RepID=A0AAV6U761_9ARAC|nr:hypothetical protein JTE90_021284 [Oedothorax gibbosus]